MVSDGYGRGERDRRTNIGLQIPTSYLSSSVFPITVVCIATLLLPILAVRSGDNGVASGRLG